VTTSPFLWAGQPLWRCVGQDVVIEAPGIEEDALLLKKQLAKQGKVLAIQLLDLAFDLPNRITIMLVDLGATFGNGWSLWVFGSDMFVVP
jgi:hypothetical protein